MDRFEDMRCFVQVVDQGSVTRAARAMSIAPSAVSRRIKDLEGRLGVQLLARTTRRMSMTEHGQTFYDRCLRILADVEEAESEVADANRALAGSLRIAAPLSFGTAHLSALISAFVSRNPELLIDLDLSDRLVDLVGEGFDLAVRIGTLRDSSLIARKLCDIRTVVCAAPALIDRLGRPRTPEDLRDWPALCYTGSERMDIWRYKAPDGTPGSVQVTVRMRANNGTVLLDAAMAGLGVALQPSFIVSDALESGMLVPILHSYQWPELGIYAVYPQTRHLSARSRAFIDYLREMIGPNPPWERALDAF